MNRPPTEPELAATALAARMSPLAIICGGGTVPAVVAAAAKRAGRRVVLFPIRGSADPALVRDYPHHWVALGQFGRFCRLAASENCRDVVLIGALVRPAVRQIRLDWGTLRVLPQIMRAFRGGDDHLLSGVARIFEAHGFRLIGAHEVAPELLVPEGPLGRLQPSDRDRADIARGLALIEAIGPFDIGQAVVVADGHVLAVEGVEGTDHLLDRIAELRSRGRLHAPIGVGVLVKAPKAGQDHRFDLPSIGPRTVEGVARAGLAGLAVLADATLVAEVDRVLASAERAGIFVVGVRGADAGKR
jgi:UDP-2,3-diacylglucosamine hydrolase